METKKLWLLHRDNCLEVSSSVKSEEVLLSERNNAVNKSVDSEVSSFVDSCTALILVTFLSDDDISCYCYLPTEEFDSSVLGIWISTVLGRSTGFFVCHCWFVKCKVRCIKVLCGILRYLRLILANIAWNFCKRLYSAYVFEDYIKSGYDCKREYIVICGQLEGRYMSRKSSFKKVLP